LPGARVQPANIAVALRRRTPWEAIDLGLSMLQQWRRAAYLPHLAVGGGIAAAALLFSWYLDRPWVAIVLVWWLKPLYDRVVLHVLSRAVFGERPVTRAVLADWREWLGTGLPMALTFGRFDLARSFNLPVRQLEGQSGRAGRERKSTLGRRARSYAVWLTAVCSVFEWVLYTMLGGLAELALPAKATEGSTSLFEALAGGELWTYGGAVGYAAAVLLLEPFYVAAGFGLYLNRRTLLEGWDIEVALRRLAERHAAIVLVLVGLFCGMNFPLDANAQEKNPKKEIAEVLKAKEFGYERESTRWQQRNPSEPRKRDSSDREGFGGFGYALARGIEVLAWILAGAVLAYALWFLARMLPRGREPPPEPYRPPPALFGMDLAPETLPADVAAAAAALAREGKLREALGLLYRGSLSGLVHKRGVRLMASHTELEVLNLSGLEIHAYLEKLIDAWRLCAYAKRDPAIADIERLAQGYRVSFA
jgi:hypothetical protein